MSEPTPGPYEVETSVECIGFGIHAVGRGCIAERWYDTAQASDYKSEVAATGRLLAASWEMLEACKAGARYSDALGRCQGQEMTGSVIQSEDLYRLFEDWHDKTHAVLAKIRG